MPDLRAGDAHRRHRLPGLQGTAHQPTVILELALPQADLGRDGRDLEVAQGLDAGGQQSRRHLAKLRQGRGDATELALDVPPLPRPGQGLLGVLEHPPAPAGGVEAPGGERELPQVMDAVGIQRRPVQGGEVLHLAQTAEQPGEVHRRLA